MTRGVEVGIGRGAVALLAAALGLHPIVTPDVWWHLASGGWILRNGAVPRTDPFTYTLVDHTWVNLQWLGDVVLVRLYRFAGADGLILVKVVTLIAVGWLLLSLVQRAGTSVAAGTAAVSLALLASAERTMVRPELASYLGIAITLVLVQSTRNGSSRAPWFLPGVTVVWINFHSLAFLAPLVIGWHALLALVATPSDRPAARRLGLGAGAAILALLANPYGTAAWTFPLTLFERIDANPDAFANVLEFASPLSEPGDPALRFFWILLLLGVLSAVAGGRRQWTSAAAVLPFLGLALLARRNVPLFAIAVVPLVASQFDAGARRWAAGFGALRPALPIGVVAIGAVAVAIAVFGGASPRMLGLHRDRGLGVTPGLFPEACLVSLDTSLTTDQALFHDMDFGGYIAWRDPARRTFIDGRLEVAGPDWLRSYLQMHSDPVVWERARASWDFRAALVQHSSAGSAAFLVGLMDLGWTPICYSAEAVLLMEGALAREQGRLPGPGTADAEWDRVLHETRGPEPHAGRALSMITEPLHRALSPSVPGAAVRRAVRLANLWLTLGDAASARRGYERVLDVSPEDPEALFNLGMCDLRDGRPDRARAHWETWKSRVPRSHRPVFERALRELAPRASTP